MNKLGENIKTLRLSNKMSQSVLAKELRVSQTSVAHYEADSRQPSIETLIQLAKLFNVTVDVLIGSKPKRGTVGAKTLDVSRVIELLLNKGESEFVKLMKEHLKDNQPDRVMDELLRPVLYEVGTLWEKGIITEADEHYATNCIRKILHYISIENNESIKGKKAISFVISTEKHTIGMEMISTFLSLNGINVYYLGCDLPHESIIKAIGEISPDYIFISITLDTYKNNLVRLINSINSNFNQTFTIGLGGQGIEQKQNLIKDHKNVVIVKDNNELLELINN